MTAPVNLGKVRKARAKAAKKAGAAANAVRFGRTRAQRKREDGERDRAEAKIDAHRRDP